MIDSEILHRGHISRRSLPANLDRDDLRLFDHELTREISPAAMLCFHDVYVHPSGCLSQGNRILPISFASPEHLTLKAKLKALAGKFRFKQIEKIQTDALWITDNWSFGYFHWITDALTRLYVAQDKISDAVLLLPGVYQKMEYITSSLAPFAHREMRFVHHPLRCDTLFIPSHTAPTGNYNEEVIKGLRSLYADFYRSSQGNDLSDKIYLSRRGAKRRMIVNEEECIQVFETYGFKTLQFESLSFELQVKISLNTRFMISNHGAGLTNMLFMSPGCSVLELRKEGDSHNNCYYTLASARGLQYYYQLCKTEKENEDAGTANLVVDCRLLKRNIENMLTG